MLLSPALSDDRDPQVGSTLEGRPETNKRLLLVSYHFPPDAEVGAVRAQKLVKYLPRCGWEPLVLTVDPRQYEAHDATRLTDVAQARVWRTGMLPNPRGFALAVRASLRRRLQQPRVWVSTRAETPDIPFELKETEVRGVRARLRRLLLSLCFLPDAYLGWLPPALHQGLRIVKRERPQAIITTAPPHTVHLVGLWLARITRLPWLADFRDPWTTNPAKPRMARSGLSDAVEGRLEGTVVRRAHAVVLTTDRLRVRLASRYPSEPSTKFVTIPNGFDPDDFAALPPVQPSDRFLVTHVGSIYYRRSAGAFLEAAAALVRSGEIPRPDLQIAFVGSPPWEAREFWCAVDALELRGAVEHVGLVAKQEALMWMRRSRLLLLLAQDQPLQVPAKTFEYLASGTPILAITEDGATADLVTRLGGFVAHDNPAEIAGVLRRCYIAQRAAGSNRLESPWHDPRLREYHRRHLAARLAALLDQVVG